MRAVRSSLLVVVPLLWLGAGYALAHAADEVAVSLTADKEELTVGEVVSLMLNVTYPEGYQVILPRLPREWGDFEVRDQSPSSTSSGGDGSETISQTIEVTLFAPGTYETPKLAVTVRMPDGVVREQPAPGVSVTVVPVLGEEDTELRDIKPQADLEVPPVWPWAAGGLLAVLAIAAAVYVFLKRRGRLEAGLALVVDSRSPYERARDELDRIERLKLLDDGRFKEHYTLVSDCVRLYVQELFEVPALDHTTDEVRSGLRAMSVGPEVSSETVRLLRDADLVKFARLRPGLEAGRLFSQEARDLIDLARPAIVAPVPDAESHPAEVAVP